MISVVELSVYVSRWQLEWIVVDVEIDERVEVAQAERQAREPIGRAVEGDEEAQLGELLGQLDEAVAAHVERAECGHVAALHRQVGDLVGADVELDELVEGADLLGQRDEPIVAHGEYLQRVERAQRRRQEAQRVRAEVERAQAAQCRRWRQHDAAAAYKAPWRLHCGVDGVQRAQLVGGHVELLERVEERELARKLDEPVVRQVDGERVAEVVVDGETRRILGEILGGEEQIARLARFVE